MNPFEAVGEVQITANGARRVRQGHLWVYASDVIREPESEPCVFVNVLDPTGKQLGWALYSRRSEIRLRFLSRDAEAPTVEFVRERLRVAVARRAHRNAAGSACRLVFGEADLLPSVIVDRFDGCLAIQTLSAGADAIKESIVDILEESLRPACIYERNDVRARLLEGLDETKGVLRGKVPGEIEIVEHGIRFVVDLSGGQKTGYFLDQSDNRAAAAAYSAGRALDCFTNTGAFALHFAARCESVIGVDTSSESLTLARRNAALNGCGNVEFREENVFDLMREFDRSGERFDVVCLDPPAFAKNRKAIAAAIGGYKEINLRAMRILNPDGILVTSSCSYHLSEAQLYEVIQSAAQDARRYVQVLERRGQSSDHPVLVGMPETHYLKCFVLRIV
jgi:23S rRNA (cytosine1962-C5)-methyltransferase